MQLRHGRGDDGAVNSPQVLLVPGNPLDLRSDDLEPLAAQVEREHGVSASVWGVPQRGYGVTWWEVLFIYMATRAPTRLQVTLSSYCWTE